MRLLRLASNQQLASSQRRAAGSIGEEAISRARLQRPATARPASQQDRRRKTQGQFGRVTMISVRKPTVFRTGNLPTPAALKTQFPGPFWERVLRTVRAPSAKRFYKRGYHTPRRLGGNMLGSTWPGSRVLTSMVAKLVRLLQRKAGNEPGAWIRWPPR
jgi:hypothetical protein